MLYFVSHGSISKVDARGEIFVFLFSRTQENSFLDTFSENFLCHKCFFVRQKDGGAMSPPGLPSCVGPDGSQ